MATCAHCGTGFSAGSADERYCCRGCEFVADLISEEGFEKFYELKQGLAVAPVKSRPFEEHDFSWLADKVAAAEQDARGQGCEARLDLGLEGISCVGCVWLIQRLFTRHPGSIRAASNPASGRLHLEWMPGKCDLEEFLRELCRFGYVAAPSVHGGGDHERRRLAARMGLCAAFALNTMAFSLPVYLGMPRDFEFADLFRLIAFLSATLSMLVGAGYFIDRAWRAVRAGSLHIDLPIALGLIVAYLGSIAGWVLDAERLLYFDFVSVFVFLMLAGRYLQTAAVERNRRRLVRRQPVPDELRLAGDDARVVQRDALEPGMRFSLEAGQALPVSGVLADGEADFSLEWIHGEADPVRHAAGARLPAGAILLSREPVWITAGERWVDSLLARLTAPVEGERAAPGLDRLLRVYLAVVLVLGVIALIFWATRGDWLTGVQSMISVFVVSCPCALGVAIPLADNIVASAMERLGAFVRSATIWPRLRRVRKVIFDKTGTLTLERPVLVNPAAVSSLDDPAALALARLTSGSLHPVSRSLLEALGIRGQRLLTGHPAIRPQEFPGAGVMLDDGPDRWSLGKAGWLGDKENHDASGAQSELRKNGALIAAFVFRESLRPDVAKTLAFLQRHSLTPHILSGDHPDKVALAARVLGLPHDRAHGGLSPEEKAARVKTLDAGDTLYLGDGANDSLAFDAALVTGTPVVDRSLLETKADFFTLGAGLGFLPDLFLAAAARARGVRAAFGFALIYNVTTVAFSMAGMMSPLLAAILMPLSSLASIAIIVALVRWKITDRGLKSHSQPLASA
jgi:Cu2+-exporting ATPase